MNAHSKPRETITEDGEVVTTALSPVETGSLAVSLARAEIDMQVTTAHAFPRSIDRAVKNIMSLATLDEKTAAECIYALPRSGKAIRGPSVRFAEIIQSQWGNCRTGARVVHVDRIERYVEAEGVFHDLETNSATTSRVRRRISDKEGRVFNEDMIVVTGNAACSIAKRNAVLGGIPKAAWRAAYDEVEKVIAGDVVTIAENRARAIDAFKIYGIKPEQIFAALEVGGDADVGLEQILTLRGMFSAIKSGEATVEEMFPRPRPAPGSGPKDLSGKLDALAGKQNGNGATTPASNGGEAAATEGGASPATEQASQQSGTPVHATTTAAGQAAPDPAQAGTQPSPAPSGAATVPTNAEEYVVSARAWITEVEAGTISPDAAKARWKNELKLRNDCGLTTVDRDPLKEKLDKIIADKKAAA